MSYGVLVIARQRQLMKEVMRELVNTYGIAWGSQRTKNKYKRLLTLTWYEELVFFIFPHRVNQLFHPVI
jgi:hypothetical protein